MKMWMQFNVMPRTKSFLYTHSLTNLLIYYTHVSLSQDVRAFSNKDTFDTIAISRQTDANGTVNEYVSSFAKNIDT